MPLPNSSIQPVCLQIEQPCLQKGHDASSSSPGSTKGKKPGLTRILRASFSNI